MDFDFDTSSEDILPAEKIAPVHAGLMHLRLILHSLARLHWSRLGVSTTGRIYRLFPNDTVAVSDYVETDLNAPAFDASTMFGVRSTTADIRIEFNNIQFFDEYDQ